MPTGAAEMIIAQKSETSPIQLFGKQVLLTEYRRMPKFRHAILLVYMIKSGTNTTELNLYSALRLAAAEKNCEGVKRLGVDGLNGAKRLNILNDFNNVHTHFMAGS